LTYSPPSSAADLTILSREQAAGTFDPREAPREWFADNARLAILFPPGFVVSASPAMLALFETRDCEGLETRLARGEGPSARRLRHLAATLPVGEPRLEQMRLVVEGRPAGVNLRCVRIGAPGGASWLLVSAPALGAATCEPPAAAEDCEGPQGEAPQREDSAMPDRGEAPPSHVGGSPPNSRFLWTLDEEGRFGDPHSALVAAVGANAPGRGESIDALLRRTGLDGDVLARALGERRTFSGLTVEWPLSEVGRRRMVALSAAPLFGRHREFLGYRGFGVLGEEIEDDVQSRESGAEPIESNLDVGPTDAPVADSPPETSLGADGAKPAPALSEGSEAGLAPPREDVEAEPRTHETIAAPTEANLEFSASDVAGPAAPTDISLEAEKSQPAPALTEAFEAERPSSGHALEAEAPALESAAKSMEPISEPALTDAPEALHPPSSGGAESDLAALTEAGAGGGPAAVATQPDLVERPVVSEAQPPPERTAEIYVLRHLAPTLPSNIVPIRPGALEALARESAQSFPAETIELSRSERDAFREIARALVGRAPASRDDSSDGGTGGDTRREIAIQDRAGQPADREGELNPARAANVDEIQRNAGAVLDRMPVGVLIARDGRALYANRTLLELVGYRDFFEFQAANALSRMFRDRDPQAMTAEDVGAVAIVRADGQILSVDGHAQVISWDGAPATLIALRRSLEAEFRARLRAHESETPARSGVASDLQAMLDRAADGAVTLDSAGRILSLNEPAERLFGYHQNEIAGESLLMLLSPQSHPETTARLESLSRGGEAETAFRPLQVVGRDRDGASIPLALTLARIGPGEAPQFCALVRDLSRERETERRLIAAREAAEAASAAKTDFLAQVSHEIRTPLHAILGFAEVMLEERFGPVGNERYRDYLKDIHASGSHVMSLADDLLDLSKIEAGKLELAFAAVDANSVIRECVSLMQPQAARERVIMRVSLHDRLPLVMVDERSLKQIMLNLMSNAVKFNEPGGQVIVSTAVDAAGQAVIRVRDTGVGMNESEVGLALTPFGQAGKGGAKGGAGLGLPLTKALVEANKAEFSIKSRREQGTLIEIAFPNIQAA
jgi:PAS domain S-box-containing protein